MYNSIGFRQLHMNLVNTSYKLYSHLSLQRLDAMLVDCNT
jgi:hypothetical protein